MNYNASYPQTQFSKALLTGLFGGLMATLTCLLYGFIYRFNTGFNMSEIINVPSIIIVCHLLLLLFGMLYHGFREMFKKFANAAFTVLFILLTIFCIAEASTVVRSPVHQLTVQFRGLLIGMIIIIGLITSLGVPFLFSNRKFQQEVI